jgi:tetratricopeptide (TPR) repeat protein
MGDSAKVQAAAAAVERAAVSEEERRAKWLRARRSLERADGFMQTGRFPEALPLYTSVTAEVPEYADAWFAAGICYGQTGDAGKAEQSLRSFLRLQPGSAEGHSALGVLLISQQRFTEARAELQEALRLDPASAEAREALQMLSNAEK